MSSATRTAQPATMAQALPEFLGLLLILIASSGAFYKFGLASMAWALIYAAVLVLSLRDHASLLDAATRCWPLLLFPMFCLLSVFWSVEPTDSLRHAVQYLFTTLIAFWIGTRFRTETLFAAVALALTLCAVVAIAGTYGGVIDGVRQGDYIGAERYLVGLYTQKNVFGVALVFATLALHVTGACRGQRVLFGAIAVALLPVLWLTKSTTGLLLYVATWTYFPVLWLVQKRTSAALLGVAALAAGLGTLLVLIAADVHLVRDALAMLGKDATLTGRTVIWEKAADIALERPLLGIGYQAFWESPRYANDVLMIRAAVLESIGGFHNGYLEATVATGLIGALFYVLALLSAVGATVRAALRRPGPAQIGAVFMSVLICSRTATESSGYYQHDIDFIVLVSLAVAATLALNSAEPSSDVQRIEEVQHV